MLSLLMVAGCAATPPATRGTPTPATAARGAASPPGAAEGAGGADIGQSIFFAPGTADLTPDARRQLAGWADVLGRQPGPPVTIVGHGDERSTRDYSIALGAQRAHAVKAYLVALGVPPDRLVTTSLGLERPAAPGSSEQARALDRRAELVFESVAAAPR